MLTAAQDYDEEFHGGGIHLYKTMLTAAQEYDAMAKEYVRGNTCLYDNTTIISYVAEEYIHGCPVKNCQCLHFDLENDRRTSRHICLETSGMMVERKWNIVLCHLCN